MRMGPSRLAQPARQHIDGEFAGGSLRAALGDQSQGFACIGVAITCDRAIDKRDGVIGLRATEPGDCTLQGGTTTSRILPEAAQCSGCGKGNAPHEAESPHSVLTVWDTRRR